MAAAESFTGFFPSYEKPKLSVLSLPGGAMVKIGSRITYNSATDTAVHAARLYTRGGITTVVVKEISLDYPNEQQKEKVLTRAYREYLLSCMVGAQGVGPEMFGMIRQDDRLFFVMNYVQGGDVKKIRQMPVGDVMNLAEHVLQTLYMLHDPHPGSVYYQALVDSFAPGDRPKIRHGDIKPDNIMKGKEGNALLIDFGGVKQEAVEETLFGTLVYFAPEQVKVYTSGKRRGETPMITRAADLYALSVVVWQLLTGVSHAGLLEMHGITAYSLTERMGRYLNSQDHVSDMLSILEQTCPDVPLSVYHLLEVGLQPDPRNRFIAAFQMLEAVRDIQKEILLGA